MQPTVCARSGPSSPISSLKRALWQVTSQTDTYEMRHAFLRQFTVRLCLLEKLAAKYKSCEAPMFGASRSSQPLSE